MKKIAFFLLFCFWATSSFAQNSIMDFYNAKVKTLSQFAGRTINPEIKSKDIINGFISYSLLETGAMGWEEMAYFTSKNGKKFVAVTNFGCGPLCGSGIPQFFELQNGALIDKTSKYLSETTSKQILDILMAKEGKLKSELGTAVPLSMWTKVPQTGTTIQFGLMEGAIENGKFYLVCEFQYDVNNGTFTLVKK